MFAALVLAAALYCAPLSAVAQHRLPAAIFDSDPNHIWNRTHNCLFVRESADGTDYGADALEPLLWPSTQYLLTGDSHRRALTCLDEFLRSHAERIVQDPLKRAIFQHDLWAVFDWASAGDDLPEQRRELETRLAEAMRRVAITPEQARMLPDTYSSGSLQPPTIRTIQSSRSFHQSCFDQMVRGCASAPILRSPRQLCIFPAARDSLSSCDCQKDAMRR